MSSVAFEGLNRINVTVGKTPVNPDRVQMRNGCMTIKIAPSAIVSSIQAARPWFGSGGLPAMVYALVGLGIDRPVLIARYVNSTDKCLRVTMHHMVNRGILMRVSNGHYAVTEQPIDHLTDPSWLRALDLLLRREGTLSPARAEYLFRHTYELPVTMFKMIERRVKKGWLTWDNAIHPFNRTLAYGLITKRYRIHPTEPYVFCK